MGARIAPSRGNWRGGIRHDRYNRSSRVARRPGNREFAHETAGRCVPMRQFVRSGLIASIVVGLAAVAGAQAPSAKPAGPRGPGHQGRDAASPADPRPGPRDRQRRDDHPRGALSGSSTPRRPAGCRGRAGDLQDRHGRPRQQQAGQAIPPEAEVARGHREGRRMPSSPTSRRSSRRTARTSTSRSPRTGSPWPRSATT